MRFILSFLNAVAGILYLRLSVLIFAAVPLSVTAMEEIAQLLDMDSGHVRLATGGVFGVAAGTFLLTSLLFCWNRRFVDRPGGWMWTMSLYGAVSCATGLFAEVYLRSEPHWTVIKLGAVVLSVALANLTVFYYRPLHVSEEDAW